MDEAGVWVYPIEKNHMQAKAGVGFSFIFHARLISLLPRQGHIPSLFSFDKEYQKCSKLLRSS